jgi:NADH-quinone oxidoreductase subunit M
MLYMFQRLFYGKIEDPANRRLPDLLRWEGALVGCLVAVVIWGGLQPGTFLRPMEASLQASRLMAIEPAGKRPVWADLSQSIDMSESSRTRGALLSGGRVRTPADLHQRFPREVASATDIPGGTP